MEINQQQKERIVIAGGTGFLGLNLAKYLSDKGYEVSIISRHSPKEPIPWKHSTWDGRTVGHWALELEGAKALVNLAGRSVDCIKTPDHCDEILRSRVESTEVLGKAVRAIKRPPKVWVQMSTAHIYGDPATVVCDEDSAFGYGLAPVVGKTWEDAFNHAALPEMRKVILRTSFVLGKTRGALQRLKFLTRLGLGGKVSNGKQGISWIHEHDMNHLFYQAITNNGMEGIYIATAPHPVSNETFMRELRKAMGIPFGLPSANWMGNLGARFVMKTDPELALYGRYCISKRLQQEEFEFQFPELKGALKSLF